MVKRRGFLGLMAGAAAAAPTMAQEAAGQIASGGLSGGLVSAGNTGFGQAVLAGASDQWARDELAQLLGKTAAQIAREKRQITVSHFDGDIAAMRSLAWHAKVAMQQEREYERSHSGRRDWLQSVIDSALSH